jgi:DNA-binding transcriptional regulator YiaG
MLADRPDFNDIPVVHNRNFSLPTTYYPNYQITKEIPRNVYKPSYPVKINSLGDLIRKTRMDLGLQIKDLAKILKVEEDTIINWEYRRKQPQLHLLKSVVTFLKPNINGSMPEADFWNICFEKNPSYPKRINSFGERLRATRMQNFLTIPGLAVELGVDPTSVAKWERMEAKPIPEYMDRVLAWVKQNG